MTNETRARIVNFILTHWEKFLIAGYLLVAVLTYGSISGPYFHNDNPQGYHDGDWFFEGMVGPFIAGALWFIYWPLHLSFLLFRG
jgi:hypothetical protein